MMSVVLENSVALGSRMPRYCASHKGHSGSPLAQSKASKCQNSHVRREHRCITHTQAPAAVSTPFFNSKHIPPDQPAASIASYPQVLPLACLSCLCVVWSGLVYTEDRNTTQEKEAATSLSPPLLPTVTDDSWSLTAQFRAFVRHISDAGWVPGPTYKRVARKV